VGRFWCKLFFTIFFIGLSGLGSAMAASNQNLVYQGRVIRPDGNPIDSGNVTFSLSVYSPSSSHCLLYSETQTVAMDGSKGFFSLNLGSGTRTDGGSHSFNQVFVNNNTLSGLTCSTGSSFAAGGTDDRTLEVSLNDAGTRVALTPMTIKSVPFALQAHEIDGWNINNLVKVSSVGSATTFTTAEMANAKAITGASCSINEILKWNGTTWACASDATGSSFTSPLTTKGDLIGFNGTAAIRLPAGTNGYVLQADSSTASGLKWAAASTPADASYSTKGLVQFLTDASTSGVTISGGVANVNAGTGANQIVKLDASSKLPAVDGSALTNLNTASMTSGTLSISRGGTAASSFAANAVIVSNGTGTALQALNCGSGQAIVFDASGFAGCGVGSSSSFFNGGNSFGANATLGTNDAWSLQFKTNNTVQMAIDVSGNVGIGTTSPSASLDVNGTATVGASTESTSAWISSGAAYTIPNTTLNIQRISLNSNTTLTLPAFTTPANKVWTLTVIVKQDATGGRTLAWAAPGTDSILWDQSATAPAAASGASKTTIYQFTKVSNDTVWYGSQVWKQN
jgi:hypothetical protein